jgi:hypothetical protein
MGKRRVAYWVLVGKSEGRRLLGRPRREGRITLKWILEKWDVGNGLDWSDSG